MEGERARLDSNRTGMMAARGSQTDRMMVASSGHGVRNSIGGM